MSHLDSDLEEGEILDDSPSSPYPISNTTKNYKKLPRRYVLHENKSTHKGKHKKDCKYANNKYAITIRHQARKLAKLKKTSSKLKDCHKKSCSHKNVNIPAVTSSSHDSKTVIKDIFSKNGHTHHNHNLVEKIKHPLKQHNVNRHNSRLSKSEIENIKAMTNCTFSEMLLHRKNLQAHQKNIADSVIHSNEISQNSNESCVDDVTYIPRIEVEKDTIDGNELNAVLPKSEANSAESEDEEELRRIALATCAKRVTDAKKLSENVVSENRPQISDCINVVPESPENKIPHISCHENSNDASDNYDVVDMDLDEEMQNTFINQENDNLFVIDTVPLSNCQENFQENSNHELHTVQDSSDEEFNTDILRAELINNLLRRRRVLENSINEAKSSNITNIAASSLKSDKEATSVKRTGNLNIHHDKPVVHEANESPKRLVISLKDDSSSSEESEQEEEEKANPSSENPVASIVALISDIRQKSDSSEKNDQVNVAPGALSCLSKAQQQEYNSLMEILAKKKKIPGENQDKKKTLRSPLNDLKLLEKKLLVVRVTLNKKKDLMSNLSKEVNLKKHMYMKSKLAAHNFKEKYIAAEKVRRIKLAAWSKSCRNYDAVQKSVSGLENKITQLQDLCSKIGASIQGQNYNLPTRRELSR